MHTEQEVWPFADRQFSEEIGGKLPFVQIGGSWEPPEHRPRELIWSQQAWLFSQNFLHRSTLGEFVDQFVQVADFPHCGFLDVFHADAADHSCNQRSRGIHLRRMREEILEVCVLRQLIIQRLLAVPRQSMTSSTSAFVRPFFSALAI